MSLKDDNQFSNRPPPGEGDGEPRPPRLAPTSGGRGGGPRLRTSENEPVNQNEATATLSSSASRTSRRSALVDADLSTRSGNYIYSIGQAGAGKSTFQCYLMRYLYEGRKDLDRPPEFGMSLRFNEDNFDSQVLLDEWTNVWRKNSFPLSTEASDNAIREFTFDATPTRYKRPPLRFSFIEVSGEYFSQTSASQNSDQNPNFARIPFEFLNNEKLNLLLVLLIDPDKENDAQFFRNFFDYIDYNIGSSVFRRSSVLALVSKPETALQKLKERVPKIRMARDMTGDLAILYIRTFLPEIWAYVQQKWPENRRHASGFSIGRINDQEANLGSGTTVEDLSLADSEKVFKFVYRTFSGQPYGPTGIQRFWRWIRE